MNISIEVSNLPPPPPTGGAASDSDAAATAPSFHEHLDRAQQQTDRKDDPPPAPTSAPPRERSRGEKRDAPRAPADDDSASIQATSPTDDAAKSDPAGDSEPADATAVQAENGSATKKPGNAESEDAQAANDLIAALAVTPQVQPATVVVPKVTGDAAKEADVKNPNVSNAKEQSTVDPTKVIEDVPTASPAATATAIAPDATTELAEDTATPTEPVAEAIAPQKAAAKAPTLPVEEKAVATRELAQAVATAEKRVDAPDPQPSPVDTGKTSSPNTPGPDDEKKNVARTTVDPALAPAFDASIAATAAIGEAATESAAVPASDPGPSSATPDAKVSGPSESASPTPTASAPATAQTATPPAGNRLAFGLGPQSQPAGSSDSGRGTVEVDRVRFVQRVARALQTAGSQGGEIRVRLSPPELGSVRIEIRLDQGQMTARLEAETPQAQSLLMESVPELRDRLAQQDVKLVRCDVGLFQQSTGGQPNFPDRSATPNDRNGNSRRTSAPASGTVDSPRAARGVGASDDGRLNVLI